MSNKTKDVIVQTIVQIVIVILTVVFIYVASILLLFFHNIILREIMCGLQIFPKRGRGGNSLPLQPISCLVDPSGIEPLTSALQMRCSTN